jgi:hypothetical protein
MVSGRARPRLLGQQCVDGVGAVGLAKLLAQIALSQDARDAGQSAQVLGAGVRRREEGEDQVHRTVVDGVELDRLFETHEDSPDAPQALESRMRDGDPVADAGRPGGLALDETFEHVGRLQPVKTRRHLGDDRERLTLAGCGHPWRDRATVQKITDIHPPNAFTRLAVAIRFKLYSKRAECGAFGAI